MGSRSSDRMGRGRRLLRTSPCVARKCHLAARRALQMNVRTLTSLVQCLRGELAGGTGDRIAWEPVLKTANDHLLTPALWGALCGAGQVASLPADVAKYLTTLHRLNDDRNRALKRQAIELIGALNERRIVPILLKGGLALFDGPYADPATRMMRDLDILVPAASRDDSIAVLERLGYRLVAG